MVKTKPVYLDVYIDAEWGSTNETLCLQLKIYAFKKTLDYIVFNEDKQELLEKKGIMEGWNTKMRAFVLFHDFDPTRDVLTEVIRRFLQENEVNQKPEEKEQTSDQENEVNQKPKETEQTSDQENEKNQKSEETEQTLDQENENAETEKKNYLANIFFFYSPKDLHIALGYENFKIKALEKNRNGKWLIEQKRSITGSFKVHAEDFQITYVLRDLAGWSGRGGLLELAKSVGVGDHLTKTSLDHYKNSMEVALETHTETFIRYSLNDVSLLKQIVTNKTKMVNRVINEVLGIHKKYSRNTIPYTTGALVSDVFTNFLFQRFAQETGFQITTNKEDILTLALAKIGILDRDKKKYKENLELHHTIFDKKKKTVEEFFQKEEKDGFQKEEQGTQKEEEAFQKEEDDIQKEEDGTQKEEAALQEENTQTKLFLKKATQDKGIYKFLGYSQASIPSFLENHANTTGILNALVQGGRVNNERPFETTRNWCADIDLSSCYGTALREFQFPIGLPTTYTCTPNEKRITLKQFLELYQNDLVPGLYTITVSGNLSFPQDLIFSKLTTPGKMKSTFFGENRKFGESQEDLAHIHADLVLVRKQIENGIITADVLELINTVSTSREKREFLDLQVETACWYSKKEQKTSFDSWVETVLKDDGDYVYNMETQSIWDTRTRAWISLPLEEFVGRLVDERKKVKKLAKIKREKGFTKQAQELEALEQSIKLLINVLYGCFASPYFKIGNTVLANNITARARCEVWKMAKALNLSSTITDGGAYSLTDVLLFKNNATKKPGFSFFSSMTKTDNVKHRSLEKGNLGQISWESVFKNPERHHEFQQLDELATTHLQNFWKNYGIDMKMKVEHKLASTAIKASHFLKAHYLQLAWNQTGRKWNRLNYAIRGAKLEKEQEFLHPMFQILLTLLLENGNLDQIKLDYNQKKLLKIANWRKIQASTKKTEQEKNIKPGETIITQGTFRLFNTYLPIDSLKEHERKKKRTVRKEHKMGFERYFPQGIDITIKKMESDKLTTKITYTPSNIQMFWDTCVLNEKEKTIYLKEKETQHQQHQEQQDNQCNYPL